MVKTAAGFIVVISIVVILILGKELLLPFIFAILVWLVMRKLRQALDIFGFMKKYVPLWIKTLLSSVFLVLILISFGKLIEINIKELESSIPSDSVHYKKLVDQIQVIAPVTIDDLKNNNDLKSTLGSYLSSFVNSLTAMVSNVFLILLYVIFILLEESSFKNKLTILLPKYTHRERSKAILDKIEHSLSNYVGLKSLLGVMAAGGSTMILYLMGVQSPVFWGLTAFILYYIPTLGTILSSALPALFYFVVTGDYYYAFGVFAGVYGAQVVVSNFLEPRIMGNSLNVSPLATVIALVFWGSIWGLTGMFLSVPITVIMVIVFAHFPNTRNIAVLLSEKGEIRNI